ALAFPAQAQDLRGLKTAAAAKGLVFGSAAATYELKDADFTPVLLRDAAQLVPEYEMKRDALETAPGVYDFTALDSLFAFARRGGLSMRGHTLVWYYANPKWLPALLAARRDEKLLTGHIQTVLRRYPMDSVDVVNEALAPPGTAIRADGLRPSPWLDAFGPGYIDLAFHAARAADPKVKLVYNEWGFEQGGAENDRFRSLTLKFLDGLLKRGVPIDALGMQGHLNAFGNRVDQKKLRDFVAEIRARGLMLLITELDVDDTGGPYDDAARDRAVADEARRFLDVALDSPATQAVLTWNLSDRYVDPPDEWKWKLLGWRFRKTPYDARMRPKPLWEAMARAFAGRRLPGSPGPGPL
ncbi:MAG TPA: endo-1,4-beta-xylanase, partial [Rhizomicrobium sp.]